MNLRLQRFCREHKIRWEYETDTDVEFIAPRGFRFGNDSRYRIVDTEMESTETILGLLELTR